MASSRSMLIHASLVDLVLVHAQQEQFQKSNFHKKEPYGSFFIAFILFTYKKFHRDPAYDHPEMDIVAGLHEPHPDLH